MSKVSVPFRGFSFINMVAGATVGRLMVSVPFRGFSFINELSGTWYHARTDTVSVPFRGFSFINVHIPDEQLGHLRFRPLSGFFFYKRKYRHSTQFGTSVFPSPFGVFLL